NPPPPRMRRGARRRPIARPERIDPAGPRPGRRGEEARLGRSRKLGTIAAVQVAGVALLVLALSSGRVPLGVPGEWEWLRVPAGPEAAGLVAAGLALAGYVAVAALGMRRLARRGA